MNKKESLEEIVDTLLRLWPLILLFGVFVSGIICSVAK
jgi:hypothetical protein